MLSSYRRDVDFNRLVCRLSGLWETLLGDGYCLDCGTED